MDDLWQQFHRLPKSIRDAVATPEALATVERLENAHPGLDLANFVMRVMAKDFPLPELAEKIQEEGGIDEAAAKSVADELQAGVFSSVGEFLGYFPTKPVSSPIAPELPRPKPQPVTPPPPVAVAPVTPKPKVSVVPPSNLPVTPVATAPAPAPKPAVSPVKPVTPPTAPVFVARLPGAIDQPVVKPVNPVPPKPLPTPAPMNEPSKPIGTLAPTQEYSDADAKEIAAQAAKVRNLQSSTLDFDQIAKNTLEELHLAWPDELLTRRAEAISKSRLKDIRDSDTTQEMLTRDPKIGGLGMDTDLAKELVIKLEAKAKELKTRGMVKSPVPLPPEAPPVPPPVIEAKPIGQPPLTRVIPESGLPPGPAPAKVTEQPMPSRVIKRPPDIPLPPAMTPPPAPKPPAPAKPAQVVTPPTSFMQRSRQVDRPTISDIVRPSKTLGPAEELKSLTLTEWRRMGQGAAESSRRLIEKFQHLQRESFALWTAALSGWRQSEVYQLYLDMGRQSLDQGIPIQEVISVRAKGGQTYLSEHEFYAIADLNRKLQSY